MADAAIGVVTETLLNMVISFAAEKISLIWGVKDELEKLKKQLRMIQAMLNHVLQQKTISEPQQIWVVNLQSVSLDAQIVLEEFGYEVLRQKIEMRKKDRVQAFFSSSNPLLFRLKMAEKIKQVQQSIEYVYTEGIQISHMLEKLVKSSPDLSELRLRSTSPYIEESQIVGRKENIKALIDMLINTTYEKDLPVITIHGMGGQGKTTLAQRVYNDVKVKSSFDKTIWVCVSEDFDVKKLLDEILQCLTRTSVQLTNEEALVEKLKEELKGKTYLLVLDDVWNRDECKWNDMRNCLLQIGDVKASKILATTRDKEVALVMGTSKFHELGILSKDESLKLFEKYAFAEGGVTGTEQLVGIGAKILEKCGGLPLAIKTIASLLGSKKSKSEWLMIERSGTWNLYNGGDRVLASIKLSYDHLPSLPIKQCFAYCAVFDKDTILKKDRIIQLWMAQGLLSPLIHQQDLQMEDVGSIYYDILLKSSLFQGARRDDDNNIITSRMHDIVHDFALEVSRNFCCHVEDWRDINHSIKAVHVSIKSCQKEMWKSLIPFLPSTLRTLILKGECDLSEDLFKKFKCLSVLIIRDQRFTTVKLPNSIGKLKHLRFLEFEHTSLPESIQPQNLQTIRFVAVKNVSLPKSFTKLYYLQTLRVGVLTNGGDGFDKLTNLRHMYAYRFGPMHTLAQMGNLQTIDLSEYELNLYHVPQVEVTLFKKSGVRDLKLCWLDKTGRRRTKEGGNDNIDAIMEDLNPRPNLETLKIHGCPIRKFPSWMTKDNSLSSSLHNLKGLELKDLVDCESIPALGDLPRLERLEIRGLRKVKFITEKFYGPGNVFVFPALKKLALESMDNLEEWSIGTDPAAPAQPSSSQPSVQVRLFPRLEEMALWNLPNLCAFPNLEILQRLRVFSIQGCPNLIKSSEVMKKGQGYIEEEIGIVDDDERQKHSSSTSDVVCSLISSSAPLEYLSIDCHPSSWPKDLHHLTNLEKLLLGGDFASVEMLPWPYPNITSDAAPHSVSLRHLTLYNLREVKSLPDQLQYMSSLTELWLQNWTSLEILPEWLGNLECLDKLSLRGCPSLKELPSAKTLQRLTHLTIESCGELSKRCKRRHDSVRDKISHIPNLKIK